jgi:DNA-binding GntR family transcriptional regulator
VSDRSVSQRQPVVFGASRPVLRAGGMAVWQQLRADISRQIEDGALSPGDPLPSETALAEAYGVSRLTVRRALADLVRAGTLRTEHGVGSFVASQPLRHRIDDGQVSLLESMAKRGHKVRQLVLDARQMDHPDAGGAVPHVADTAEAAVIRPSGGPVMAGFAAAWGEPYGFPSFPGPVVEYQYIRWVDELPWSASFAVVPAALAPPSWDGANSLFAAMSAAHGVKVWRDDRRFSAVLATPDDAAWLKVPVGAPLLLLRGTNTDTEGRALAHIVHRIRGDRAEYGVRVPR